MIHLLLLLEQQQVVMVNRRGVMWRVGAMIDLIPLQVVERQRLAFLVIVVAIIVVNHLSESSELRLSVVVVAIVVVVRVVLDRDLRRRRSRLTFWRDQSEHRQLTRRVRLILLTLVRYRVVHLIHRQGTVSRCAICNFRRVLNDCRTSFSSPKLLKAPPATSKI